MAVGDIVNGLATSSDLIMQPAAGVEICITSLSSWTASSGFFNGTTYALIRAGMASGAASPIQVKIMINNTNYVKALSDANGSQYSGIQIK